MPRTKIQVIDRSHAIFTSGALTGQERASIAREHLAEAQEINRRSMGRIPEHETWVDGRYDAPLESVKPSGRIIFEFDLLTDLFTWVGEMLVKHSPVLDGDYSESHVFLADGVAVPLGAKLPVAQEYAFVNTQPYARKIERGLSSQAPAGVYEAVTSIARMKFGNLADIRFGFMTVPFGAIDAWASTASAAAWAHEHGRRSDAAVWLRRQPAIIIRTG